MVRFKTSSFDLASVTTDVGMWWGDFLAGSAFLIDSRRSKVYNL